VWAVAFYVLIKSAFVGKNALNLSKCTVKQQLKIKTFYIFYKYTPIIFVVLCLYILRTSLLLYQFYDVHFKGKLRELRMWTDTSTSTSNLINNLKPNANLFFDFITRNSQVTIRASVVELLITYFSIKVSRTQIIRGQWRLIAYGTAKFSAVANEYIFLKEIQIV
jgi:hypothetical protein